MGNIITLMNTLDSLARNSAKVVLILQQLYEQYRVAPRQLANVPNFEEMNSDELRTRARRQLHIDIDGKYNFAFVGFSGVGKSSLINALRNMDDSDVDAADVSAGIEGTAETKQYQHPQMDHVVFWDTPGCGTVTHPARTYFRDKMLYAFDCLIIVGEERFTEADVMIAETAQQYGIPFVFVRSKMDQVIKNERRRQSQLNDVQEIKQQLKRRILANISTDLVRTSICQENRQIYLVSSACFRNFDEENLMDEFELLEKVGTTGLEHRRAR